MVVMVSDCSSLGALLKPVVMMGWDGVHQVLREWEVEHGVCDVWCWEHHLEAYEVYPP